MSNKALKDGALATAEKQFLQNNVHPDKTGHIDVGIDRDEVNRRFVIRKRTDDRVLQASPLASFVGSKSAR